MRKNSLREFHRCKRTIERLTIVFDKKDTIYLIEGINKAIIHRWWSKRYNYSEWSKMAEAFKTRKHLNYYEASRMAIHYGFCLSYARELPNLEEIETMKEYKK